MAAAGRVVGTAGHIDHGKTALVRALTGIDTDRLKEEKRRGITIELGFAHLDLAAEGLPARVGVIDVPGHERFLRTMVAGAVGLDAVLLVVAADEGVMPQTREHLDVCRLLGLERGVVALTKSDLATGELRDLAMGELREALHGSFLEDAPIVPCSVLSGEGLDELRCAIAEALAGAPPKDASGLLRLPLDRVFSMKGFGTVVAGTLWAGRLRVGDEVVVLPGGATGKVRGLEVHGQAVEEAHAGQRAACNVAIDRAAVQRGNTLVGPGTLEAGRLVDMRLRHLPTSREPLRHLSRALVHAGTAQTLATVTLLDCREVAPGGEALAQLHLDQPVVALPDDRFILRGFALQREHRTTLGGGTVLRVLGPRHRRGTPHLLSELRAAERSSPEERLELEVKWAGRGGLAERALGARLHLGPRDTQAAVARLLTARRVVRFDREQGGLVHAEILAELGRRAIAAVEAHHAASPLEPGLGREELRSRLSDEVSPKLFYLVLESLTDAKELIVDREWVRRPGHDASHSQRGQSAASLAEQVVAVLSDAGLAPPRLAEVAARLSAPLPAVREAVEVLVRDGRLVKVQDLHFDRAALDRLRGRLVDHLEEHTTIGPPEWKELVGASRKFAIPLAEHFDAEKVTLRVGDLRKLRR